MSRIERRFAALRTERRAGLVTYLTAGDPDPDTSARLFGGLAAAGADLIEIGMPFSDPMADGPADPGGRPARAEAGHDLAPHPGARPRAAPRRRGDPDRADGVLQPDLPLRTGELRAGRRRRRGRRGHRRRSAARGGRRADWAGPRRRPRFHAPRDADQRRPAPAALSSSTPAASSITSRSPASPAPARPMPPMSPPRSPGCAGSPNCR